MAMPPFTAPQCAPSTHPSIPPRRSHQLLPTQCIMRWLGTHPSAMPMPPSSMAALPAHDLAVLYGSLAAPHRRPTMSASPSPPHIRLTTIMPATIHVCVKEGAGGGGLYSVRAQTLGQRTIMANHDHACSSMHCHGCGMMVMAFRGPAGLETVQLPRTVMNRRPHVQKPHTCRVVPPAQQCGGDEDQAVVERALWGERVEADGFWGWRQ